MQLVCNPKVNHPEPLSLQSVCNQGKHSLWLKQVTDKYEYCSSHDKDLCKGTTIAFLLSWKFYVPTMAVGDCLYIAGICPKICMQDVHAGLYILLVSLGQLPLKLSYVISL